MKANQYIIYNKIVKNLIGKFLLLLKYLIDNFNHTIDIILHNRKVPNNIGDRFYRTVASITNNCK